MKLDKIRKDTPCQCIYLNHASTSVPPLPVIEAASSYYDLIMHYGATSAKAEKLIYRRAEETADGLAEFLNADSGEIAIMPNGSQGISMVAAGFPIRPGCNILVDEMGFISNAAPFLRLKALYGTEVRFIPAKMPGLIDLDALEKMIDEDTVLIAVSHCANSLGLLQPLEKIGCIAKKYGILYLVNASNTVGAVNLDVKKIQCDFLAASGRKYMRGPSGSGFLYVRKEIQKLITPCFAAWTNCCWDWKPDTWDWPDNTWKPKRDISAFTYGERDYPAVFGLLRAVEYVDEIGGMSTIEKRIFDLTEQLIAGIQKIPHLHVVGPETAETRAGIVTVTSSLVSYKEMAAYLNQNNVGVMGHHFFCPGVQRLYDMDGVLRLSVHYWNLEEEIEKTLGLLKSIKTDERVEKE